MTLRELIESVKARGEFRELRYFLDLEAKMRDEQIARWEELMSKFVDAVIAELVERGLHVPAQPTSLLPGGK